VGPKDLQRPCCSVFRRNFCKLLVHALYVATDSRAAVRNDPVVMGIDRGDDDVEGREFEIGKADSHVRSVFQAWGNRVDALLLPVQDGTRPLIIERADRQKGEPCRSNYLMSILRITFRQLWRTRRLQSYQFVMGGPCSDVNWDSASINPLIHHWTPGTPMCAAGAADVLAGLVT